MANKSSRSLSARNGLENNLFETIASQVAQDDAVKKLQQTAKDFLLGDAVVYGTASFYDFTKETAQKHKVRVCSGTACMTAQTQDTLTKRLENHFEPDEIGHAACLGHCHSNAAFMYDDKTYSANNANTLQNIITTKPTITNDYTVDCNTTPILTKAITDIAAFYSLATPLKKQALKVIDELKASNLRGRGGAGFPFWFKLDAVYKEDNTQKYIVCNADEGDPGAYSDMYLMEHQAHKVLFGMYLAGLTVGADTGVLYIRGEYPNSIRSIMAAIEELKAQHIASDFKFKIIRGQGAYICGEETALLNSIEGLRPEVRVRPPYPAQYGLFGKPTVLSNVETFANIHWILENGGAAYANIGTTKSTGTKLVSLDSFFNKPGIYEIAMETPIETVINTYGGGFKTAVKAIQIGGPLGGIVPVAKLKDLTLDFESLAAHQFLLGHASFVCIPKTFPMLDYIAHLLQFTADESCGKCYPCRIGSFRGYELLTKAKDENYKIDKVLFNDLLETLELGSLCALGGGVPLPIKNALTYFDDELRTYFKN